MATKTMKKPVKEEPIIDATGVDGVEAASATATKKAKKVEKTYQDGDMIPCRSITAGEMFCSGKKTGILYKWANHSSIEDVRYEDLVYMRDSRSGYVYKPRFVIEDNELIDSKGWEKVKAVYDSMFTQKDIEEILNLPLAQFKAALTQLPSSVQDTIKVVITERIENSSFDSISKIKAVDAVLGSDLMCLVK